MTFAAHADATDDDPKRARILDGAMKLVLAYGYSRVTMEDVAKAANISRPALYLLFRNKTDIYRAIASQLFEVSVKQAAAVLAGNGSFAERMMTAIDIGMIDKMRHILESPHGAEIMDMKSSLAGDIAAKWRECFAWHFCGAIDTEATLNGVDLKTRALTPHVLADILLDGLEGMKTRTKTLDEQRQAARALVSVIELAISPR